MRRSPDRINVAAPAPASTQAQAPARHLTGWRARLARDPIPVLLREGGPMVAARVRRDLIDDDEAPRPEEIMQYPAMKAVLRKQEKNGSFPARAVEKALGDETFAGALATVRTLEMMADYGLGGTEPVKQAAEFLLSSQDREGGIGDLSIAGEGAKRKVVAVHFHGWAIAALCRAGFDADARVQAGLDYLLRNRQADGGWAWRGVRTESAARPSSHLVTGMALRAFAASPQRRGIREARRAAELLATRLMQPDRYPDRRAASHWEVLTEPRFWTDILDVTDTITAIGLAKENSGVRTAEAYLRGRQSKSGLWYPGPPPERGVPEQHDAKEKDAACAMTVRVLIVLRRIN